MWDDHTLTPASSSKLSLALFFFENIMAPLRSAAGHQFVDKLDTDLRAGRDLLKLLLAASYELLRWKCSVGASQQVFMMSPKAVAGSWATPVSLWVPRVETGRKRERECCRRPASVWWTHLSAQQVSAPNGFPYRRDTMFWPHSWNEIAEMWLHASQYCAI